MSQGRALSLSLSLFWHQMPCEQRPRAPADMASVTPNCEPKQAVPWLSRPRRVFCQRQATHTKPLLHKLQPLSKEHRPGGHTTPAGLGGRVTHRGYHKQLRFKSWPYCGQTQDKALGPCELRFAPLYNGEMKHDLCTPVARINKMTNCVFGGAGSLST